jgi:hypothetical protein
MLLLSFLQSAAQQRPAIVNLTIIHNGRQRPAPAEIRVSFGGHSLRVPVREGKFEAPPELVAAQSVTLETDVEGSHIRLIHVNGKDFTQEDWTLRLAERANDDYYDWPGPKGANIPTTCMLEFELVHTDPGRVLFEQHCRSKKK